jgi:prepilin-type N-terminal cleavage/methylation domain-containing protein
MKGSQDMMLSKPGRREAWGMSLIEVLIALTILAIATMAIFGALITSMDLNVKDREITLATNFAQRVLENIRNDCSITENFDGLNNIGFSQIRENPRMIYSTEVLTIQAGLKKLTVNVYYINEKSGFPQPDTSRANGGKIVVLSCYLIRP